MVLAAPESNIETSGLDCSYLTNSTGTTHGDGHRTHSHSRTRRSRRILVSEDTACEVASSKLFRRLDRHGTGQIEERQVLPLWPELSRHMEGTNASGLAARISHRSTPILRDEWMSLMNAIRSIVGPRLLRSSLRAAQEHLEHQPRSPSPKTSRQGSPNRKTTQEDFFLLGSVTASSPTRDLKVQRWTAPSAELQSAEKTGTPVKGLHASSLFDPMNSSPTEALHELFAKMGELPTEQPEMPPEKPATEQPEIPPEKPKELEGTDQPEQVKAAPTPQPPPSHGELSLPLPTREVDQSTESARKRSPSRSPTTSGRKSVRVSTDQLCPPQLSPKARSARSHSTISDDSDDSTEFVYYAGKLVQRPKDRRKTEHDTELAHLWDESPKVNRSEASIPDLHPGINLLAQSPQGIRISLIVPFGNSNYDIVETQSDIDERDLVDEHLEEARKAALAAEEAEKARKAKEAEDARITAELEEAKRKQAMEAAELARKAEEIARLEKEAVNDAQKAAELAEAKKRQEAEEAEAARRAEEITKMEIEFEEARKAAELEEAKRIQEMEEARKARETAEIARRAEIAQKEHEAQETRKVQEARKAELEEARQKQKMAEVEKARQAADIAKKETEAEEARIAAELEEAKRKHELEQAESTRRAEEIARLEKVTQEARNAAKMVAENLRLEMASAASRHRASTMMTQEKKADEARIAAELAEAKRQKEMEKAELARRAEEIARLEKEAVNDAQKAAELAEAKQRQEAEEAEAARRAEEIAQKEKEAEEARKAAELAEAEERRQTEEAEKAREAAEIAIKESEAAEARKAAELDEAKQKQQIEEAEKTRRAEEIAMMEKEAEEAREAAETARKESEAAEARNAAELEEAKQKQQIEAAEKTRQAEEIAMKEKEAEEARNAAELEEAKQKQQMEEAEKARRAEEIAMMEKEAEEARKASEVAEGEKQSKVAESEETDTADVSRPRSEESKKGESGSAKIGVAFLEDVAGLMKDRIEETTLDENIEGGKLRSISEDEIADLGQSGKLSRVVPAASSSETPAEGQRKPADIAEEEAFTRRYFEILEEREAQDRKKEDTDQRPLEKKGWKELKDSEEDAVQTSGKSVPSTSPSSEPSSSSTSMPPKPKIEKEDGPSLKQSKQMPSTSERLQPVPETKPSASTSLPSKPAVKQTKDIKPKEPKPKQPPPPKQPVTQSKEKEPEPEEKDKPGNKIKKASGWTKTHETIHKKPTLAKAEPEVVKLPPLQKSISAPGNLQSVEDDKYEAMISKLQDELDFERSERGRMSERVKELERKLRNAGSKPRLGITKGAPYKPVPLPPPPPASPKQTRGLHLPALRSIPHEPSPQRWLDEQSVAASAQADMDQSRSPEASRADRSKSRVDAIKKLESKGLNNWKERRAEKVARLHDLTVFRDSMWSSFFEWHEDYTLA